MAPMRVNYQQLIKYVIFTTLIIELYVHDSYKLVCKSSQSLIYGQPPLHICALQKTKPSLFGQPNAQEILGT